MYTDFATVSDALVVLSGVTQTWAGQRIGFGKHWTRSMGKTLANEKRLLLEVTPGNLKNSHLYLQRPL